MKIKSELILILSMVVLLATSGIVSQTPVAFVFADEEGGSGDSGDSGGDSGSGGDNKDDGGSSKDDGDSGKQESNDEPKEEDEKPNDKVVKAENQPDRKKMIFPKPQEDDKPKYAATDENGKRIGNLDKWPKFVKDPEEEKAAIEDYVNDEPGIKKPYPPVTDEETIVKSPINPTVTHNGKPKPSEDDPNEYCDSSKDCYGPGHTPTSDKNCLGKYCGGENVPNPNDYCKLNKWDEKKCGNDGVVGVVGGPGVHPGGPCEANPDPKCLGDWCKKHPDKCEDGGDGDGGKKHWCDWHDCHDDHHKHNHNHDNHHYDSNTKNYYYYYTNDYNNNHATVILQPDYSHTNNYHDIRVVIGDSNEFDTVIDFAGKPENLVVAGLDINAGEAFDVCMENQNDGGQTNCVTAHLQDENKAVYVDIRVP